MIAAEPERINDQAEGFLNTLQLSTFTWHKMQLAVK